MAPKPNYCRTCGSTVHSKSVCYNCGCPPLKGFSYCPGCGSSTLPEAIICVHCNASLRKKFPVVTAALVLAGIVIASAVTGIVISQMDKPSLKKILARTDTAGKVNSPVSNTKSNETKKEIHSVKSEIKNKPVLPVDSNAIKNQLLRKQKDTLARLMKTLENKPAPQKNMAPSKEISVTNFSAAELDEYTIGCSFFTSKQNKNSVAFFYTKTLGYAKINGKITEVRMKAYDKLNGLYKFANQRYDISVYIEGLSGSAQQWFAAGTLTVTDVEKGIVEQRKIFSTCAMD